MLFVITVTILHGVGIFSRLTEHRLKPSSRLSGACNTLHSFLQRGLGLRLQEPLRQQLRKPLHKPNLGWPRHHCPHPPAYITRFKFSWIGEADCKCKWKAMKDKGLSKQLTPAVAWGKKPPPLPRGPVGKGRGQNILGQQKAAGPKPR